MFLCLGAEGQRQVQQKQPDLDLHMVTTRNLITTLEDFYLLQPEFWRLKDITSFVESKRKRKSGTIPSGSI